MAKENEYIVPDEAYLLVAEGMYKHLSALRAEKKMTQRDLARASGLTQGAISRLENGDLNPKIDTLKSIAAALNMYVEGDYIEDDYAEGDDNHRQGDYEKLVAELAEIERKRLTEEAKTAHVMTTEPGNYTLGGNDITAGKSVSTKPFLTRSTEWPKTDIKINGKDIGQLSREELGKLWSPDIGPSSLGSFDTTGALSTDKLLAIGQKRNTYFSTTSKQTKPAPATIPRYSRSGAIMQDIGNHGYDGVFIGGQADQTPTPPNLIDVKGAYAIEMPGSTMSPTFRHGDILYVDPTRPATRGDDVVIQLTIQDQKIAVVGVLVHFDVYYADTHDAKEVRHEDYFCVSLATKTAIENECYAEGLHQEAEVADEVRWAADLFILTDHESAHDNTLHVADAVHVIVGTERRRPIENKNPQKITLRRQSEREVNNKPDV